MTTAGDDIARLVGKLRLVPHQVRRFTISADHARDEYQLTADLLRELRDQGMPASRSPDGWRYDPFDLLNASLHLDTGSRHRKVLAWWIREQGRPYGDVSCYMMDYRLGCPRPGHPGSCEYSLLVPGGQRIRIARTDPAEATLHTARFELSRRWPALPRSLRQLIDAAARIRFLRLPDPLRWDTDFIRANGIGDCTGVAQLIVEDARAHGIAARTGFGRSLTPPFSTPHYWAELLTDDVWTPVDPMLITALLDWGLCARDTWTRYDSFGATLGRLASRSQPIALHNGEYVEAKLPVWRVPDVQPTNLSTCASS